MIDFANFQLEYICQKKWSNLKKLKLSKNALTKVIVKWNHHNCSCLQNPNGRILKVFGFIHADSKEFHLNKIWIWKGGLIFQNSNTSHWVKEDKILTFAYMKKTFVEWIKLNNLYWKFLFLIVLIPQGTIYSIKIKVLDGKSSKFLNSKIRNNSFLRTKEAKYSETWVSMNLIISRK